MSATIRPRKVIRLNYIQNNPQVAMATITLLGSPPEVRLGISPRQFIGINDFTGITIAPGLGKQVNIQALPQNFRFGGLLMDLPFPLSIFPTTPFTPFPKQFFVPPLLPIMPDIVQIGALVPLFASPL